MIKEKVRYKMNEFFKKPNNELGKLKRTETNIQDYLDEPSID
jgi:hypothetical protein